MRARSTIAKADVQDGRNQRAWQAASFQPVPDNVMSQNHAKQVTA
ncbi:hypothetical protein [Pseudomonas viridiflava]|nr:hypothetical protein [Pseudomonas viridiflava]